MGRPAVTRYRLALSKGGSEGEEATGPTLSLAAGKWQLPNGINFDSFTFKLLVFHIIKLPSKCTVERNVFSHLKSHHGSLS